MRQEQATGLNQQRTGMGVPFWCLPLPRRAMFAVTAAAVIGPAPCPAGVDAAGPIDSDRPAVLEPVVTVATRAERPLTEVPGNVTVIDRDTLDRTLTQSLRQTFRYYPGIDASSTGTRFGAEGVIVRGIGGNRVAMELDGVPLSQQFAVGNFANAIRDLTDVGLIDRIEVLHGPASALYGSSALGGVVSFRTPDPASLQAGDGGPGLFVSQALRSDDDSRHTLGAAAAGNDSLGALGMVAVRSGHERDANAAEDLDHQDYDNRSGMAKLTYRTPGGNLFRGLYYRHDSDVETNVRSVLGTGRFASTTLLEGDDRHRLELLTAELVLGPSTSIDGGVIRLWSGAADIRQQTADERGAAARPVRIERRFDYDQDTTGASIDLHRRFTTGSWAHLLAAGVELNAQHIKESRTGYELGLEDGALSDTVLGETFPVRDFPVSDVTEIGLYLHDELDLGRARVIAGLRFDRYDLDPERDPVYSDDNPATDPVSVTEDELSPKLGLVIALAPGLSGWLQYAHGFRAPPFEDANIGLDIPLFNIRAIPNPDLRPETSDGLEAGLRWRGTRAWVDANLFYTRYDDFIETKVRLGVDADSGRLLFQSRNVEEARIFGAEIEAALSLDRWLQGFDLRAAAHWARGDNRETDEPLNSVGPPQAVLAGAWSSPDGRSEVTLLGTFTRRHSRLDDTRGSLFEAPGYALFDLYVSRRVGHHLMLRAGVENLLDRTYWQWADVRGLAPDDPTVPLLSQPGRSLALDLRWNF